ncbi:hypothetical protein I4F81_007152 [Pyropia yezoensis]|uniref:Uncharacterized protein n=1 Tax=Pyropia yezoensis TaxID=2788 RepID=A0ACC3C381_PYRYE|nr:hypothetical protein I4F81_007152 [Neopyropia yezoensis]
MSNAPDHFAAVVLPDGVQKLTYERDVKVENAGTLTIEREDHTLGNLVRMQLLRDPRVTDAAAPYLPTDAIATALRDLNAEINLIADKLDAALDAAATTMDDHGQYR